MRKQELTAALALLTEQTRLEGPTPSSMEGEDVGKSKKWHSVMVGESERRVGTTHYIC